MLCCGMPAPHIFQGLCGGILLGGADGSEQAVMQRFPMSKCSLKTRLNNTEQAKAGLPDAAWRTVVEARAAGLPLSARLYNLLIMAHARAGRAAAAEAIVHSDMAADGVAPDLVTWWVFKGVQGSRVARVFKSTAGARTLSSRPGTTWNVLVSGSALFRHCQ